MDNNDKKGAKDTSRRPLLMFFYTYVALAACLVATGEYGTVFDSVDTTSVGISEYTVLTVLELLTVCLLPLALKIMDIRMVKESASKSDRKYTAIAAARLAMIGVPVIVNIVSYYVFMNVAFAYLAIIGTVCLAFVYPNRGRKEDELNR